MYGRVILRDVKRNEEMTEDFHARIKAALACEQSKICVRVSIAHGLLAVSSFGELL
jgi:hypothetical protein